MRNEVLALVGVVVLTVAVAGCSCPLKKQCPMSKTETAAVAAEPVAAVEAPAAPVAEAEAPAVEAPVAEAPAVEVPAAEAAPVVEAPAQ